MCERDQKTGAVDHTLRRMVHDVVLSSEDLSTSVAVLTKLSMLLRLGIFKTFVFNDFPLKSEYVLLN
jgi:hypothetical protein